MKCPEYRRKISSYLDGELDTLNEKELYRHLSSCPHCAQYLDEFRSMDKLLKSSMVFLEPPEDFADGVMECINSTFDAKDKKDKTDEGSGLPQRESAGSKERESLYSRFLENRFLESITNRLKTVPKWTAAAVIVVLILAVSFFGGTAGFLGENSLWKNILVKTASAYYKVLEIGNMLEEGDSLFSKVLGNGSQEEGRKSSSDGGFVEISESLFADQKAEGNKAEVLEAETVFLTPLAVNESYNNVRPVWAGKDVIYYLSQRGAPGGNGYVVWQTNSEGSKSSIVGKRGLFIPLEIKGGAAWSSDRKKLAFVTDRNEYWEIWCSDLQGQLTNITAAFDEDAMPEKGSQWGYNPVWSVLGDLAFLTQRFGNTDIMVSSAAGKVWVIGKTENEESFPIWSPSGKQLAFFRSLRDKEGKKGGIFIADRNGEEIHQVTPLIKNAAMVPAWSPKGQWLAVNVDAGSKNSSDSGLWCVDVGGRKWSKISEFGGGKVVSWSPDGTKIAFTGKSGKLYVLYRDGDKDRGRVLPIIPEDRRGYVNYVEWSQDSRRILMEWVDAGTGKSGVWLASLP
ncbi:MAG: hypothetical protein XD50_0601 [Clostridia bacterium 41_269]|nr:MAG: hypothetical protein XD50_0601 [Clostridia bacterium 41_269]